MVSRWTFRALRTSTGNVVLEWVGSNTKLQARMDSYLRRLREMKLPWPFPYYEALGDGIGSIRFDLGNVEHRLYGFHEDDTFIILLASSDKKKQQKAIQGAKQIRASMGRVPLNTEEYVV